jgi:sigma-E factor negative regulatory protein RseA
MNQEISSLMDGELDSHASARAIGDCYSTPEAKHAWDTYHLIGDAMRGKECRPFDVSSRVMAALEQEPTVLAPRASGPTRSRTSTFGRIALAAAASVATIGVVGWIGTQGMMGRAPEGLAKSDGVTMQSNVATLQASTPVSQVRPAEPAYAAIEVNDYLAAHRQIPSPDQYRPVASRTIVPAR